MINYKVYIYFKAKKEYDKLDNTIKEKIKQRMYDLEKDPYIGTHLKKVQYWKLRVEDYRLVYQIKNTDVIILLIGHRKNIYDKFYRLYK